MAIKPVSGEIKSQDINDNFSALDSQLANLSIGPFDTYTSLSALQSAYPNGRNGFAVVLEADGKTGYMYTWTGTTWKKGGLAQSMGIAADSVGNPKIKAEAVTPEKIYQAKKILKSVNIFNYEKRTLNSYIDPNDGLSKTTTSGGVFHSEKIMCTPSTDYVFPKILTASGAWYDGDGKYISKLGNASANKTVIKSPTNAYYFAWNGDRSVIRTDLMIIKGVLSDWPAKYTGFNELYELEWLDTTNFEINQNQITGAPKQINLFDYRKVTDGKYINNSGVITNSSILSMSDKIPVNPKSTYAFSAGFTTQGVWLDKNGDYIRTITPTSTQTNFNSDAPPANAKYLIANCYTNGSDGFGKYTFMIIENATKMPENYIPYKTKLDWLAGYSDAYIGKKIVTFGDSVTWYDDKKYNQNTTSPDILVKGYQSFMRDKLSAIVINQGVSGDTTQQICARSKAYNYVGFDLVTFMCGINNFRDDATDVFGEVLPIGETLDEASFCGAYQAMIEDVIVRYPSLKIFLIIPYKVWKDNGNTMMDGKYRDAIIEIASLYSVPYINLYDDAQINSLNKSYYFADDPTKVSWLYHVNNTGYKLISDLIVPKLASIFI